MTDEEINRLVATTIMGWEWIAAQKSSDGRACYLDHSQRLRLDASDWNPAADIAQAWQVVEKMREQVAERLPDNPVLLYCEGGEWVCEFDHMNYTFVIDDMVRWIGRDVSAPKAIVLAALRAVAVALPEPPEES